VLGVYERGLGEETRDWGEQQPGLSEEVVALLCASAEFARLSGARWGGTMRSDRQLGKVLCTPVGLDARGLSVPLGRFGVQIGGVEVNVSLNGLTSRRAR
jgi:hypothetical protein